MKQKPQILLILAGLFLSVLYNNLVYAQSCDGVVFTQQQSIRLIEKFEKNLLNITTYPWLCLTFGKGFPEYLQDKAIKHFRKNRTVYLKKEDIPVEKIHTWNGKFWNYEDGYLFYLEMQCFGLNTIKVYYSWSIAGTAGGTTGIRYFWNGEDWVVLEVYPGPVA